MTKYIARYPIEIVTIVMALTFTLGMAGFATVGNFQNILSQLSPVLLMACGQAVVMLSGGLDLSQGSMVGVGSVCFITLVRNFGIAGGCAITLAIAAGIGALNAIATRGVRNSFIASFASMYVLLGAVIYATGGTPISTMTPSVRQQLGWIGSSEIAGLPVAFLFALLPIGLLTYFLNYTRRGLEVYAWGSNPTAARVHGIRELPIQLVAFISSALFACLAGIVLSARVLQGNPQMGEGLLFESIAACVVGGVALSGGIGGMWAVARGTLLIAIIQNGLYLSDLNSHIRDIVVGLMIGASVLLTRARIRGATSSLQ